MEKEFYLLFHNALPVLFLNTADANKTKGNAINMSSIKINAA